MYRVEDKYALAPPEMALMQKRMEVLLPLDHGTDGGGYRVSSVYFDDLWDTHYHDTANGNPCRKKYRIRIYNDSFSVIKLEVKEKRYNRIQKSSALITQDEMQALLGGETIEAPDDLSDPRTAFNVAIRERCLRPKVIVTYERTAFLYETGNVRITFDRGIRGSDDVERFGDPALLYEYPQEGGAVLEVKYDELLPDFLAQSLENNAMWQTANSKYRICRELYRI